jgi:laminin gamma 1
MCNSSQDYYVHTHQARFNTDSAWQAVDAYGNAVKTELSLNRDDVSVTVQSSHEDIWFLAAGEFLGNQLNSYGQDLTFQLQLLDLNQQQNYVQSARPSRKDVVLQSSQFNLEIYLPIYGATGSSRSSGGGGGNQLPSNLVQTFTFKLDQNSGWMPTLTAHDFQRLLTNLSSIRIRASYVPSTRAILSDLKLSGAKKYSPQDGQQQRDTLSPALFVEECKCPAGHVGQHCESCADGYRREPINGGPFARCVPCNCNNHSISCDPNNGRCSCLHHTSGDNCEKCKEGYYGNPIAPSTHHQHHLSSPLTDAELSNMCKKCPCPNDGPCAEIFNYQLNTPEVVCLACPAGTQGNLCELCDDGFFRPGNSIVSRCEKCTCNGNIDENAVGNCDSQSSNGRCLKCIYNTTGDQCDRCLPNFWGNALTSLKCHSCDCFASGTFEDPERAAEPRQCNLNDGQCECKANVKNRQCNECKEGFWNIKSGRGCEECRCNPLGSFNLSCDSTSGQCFCRPGVHGLKCDSCKPLWFGFSDQGCQMCQCNPFGADEKSQLQCDDFGKCACRENFAGLKCDKCAENRYNYTSGCLECDQCYNLVQDGVNGLRSKIHIIQTTLKEMLENSVNGQLNSDNNMTEENVELQNKLNRLKEMIEEMHDDLFAKNNLKPTYKESISHLQTELKRIQEAIKNTDQLFDQFNVIFKQAESLYNQASQSVLQTQLQLNKIDKLNSDKLTKLESIKQARLDHEQNVKLQNFAKQSRETAETQSQLAKNASSDLRISIENAFSSFKDLESILAKYELLEKDLEQPDQFSFNFETLKQTTSNLINETLVQKNILDESNREMQDLIKKIGEFKIPDEKETDSRNGEIKNLITDINPKVIRIL